MQVCCNSQRSSSVLKSFNQPLQGTQYRSVIFFHTPEQEAIARQVKSEVEAAGKWKGPIVTQIVPAAEFWDAEEYHQRYLDKNPGSHNINMMSK